MAEPAPASALVERLSALPRGDREQFLALMAERDRRKAQRLYYAMYGDQDAIWDGPALLGGLVETGQRLYSRHLYPKHLEFFAAGATYRERLMMAANRVGKTFGVGGFEMSAHLTGLYPDWWPGRRFDHPVSAWAAGKTNETTRDIIQSTLLGGIGYDGSRKIVDGRGMIPGATLGKPTWKSGIPDLVDTIRVRHVSGGWSELGLKSYDQGRGAFEGTGRHVIWCDEEPPEDVYDEMVIRTATMGGLVLVTFTPLEGMSNVVMRFMPQEMRPGG